MKVLWMIIDWPSWTLVEHWMWLLAKNFTWIFYCLPISQNYSLKLSVWLLERLRNSLCCCCLGGCWLRFVFSTLWMMECGFWKRWWCFCGRVWLTQSFVWKIGSHVLFRTVLLLFQGRFWAKAVRKSFRWHKEASRPINRDRSYIWQSIVLARGPMSVYLALLLRLLHKSVASYMLSLSSSPDRMLPL